MPERITDAEIERLRGLCEQATLGPWKVWGVIQADPDNHQEACCWIRGPEMIEDGDCSYLSEDDAAFIAAARTAIPALIAEVERLRGALADLLDLYYATHPRGADIKNASSEELEKRMKAIGSHIFKVGPVLKARAALGVK